MYNTYQVTYQSQSGWSNVKWVIKHSASYKWGLGGFIALISILLQSFGPLRRAFYDDIPDLAPHRNRDHNLCCILSHSEVRSPATTLFIHLCHPTRAGTSNKNTADDVL